MSAQEFPEASEPVNKFGAPEADEFGMIEDPETGEKRAFRARVVSFAARSTRLKGRQEKAWEDLAPLYVLSPKRQMSRTSIAADEVLDIDATFGRSGARNIVEIGSGQGECVENAAVTNPDTNFMPTEVYMPGLASTLHRIKRTGVENIRMIQADAAEVLNHYLPEKSIDELWIFFPDPWHKARHNKRRLVQESFTPRAARVLKEGGIWRLATDWLEYAEQMVEVIDASPYFDRVDTTERFEGRVLTSFERKGIAKGRVITDLTYVRNAVPLSAEDIATFATIHEEIGSSPEFDTDTMDPVDMDSIND